MAFPQTKTPLPLTVRKRQRRINSSAVPLLLPVQSPAPQCASNNARPVITGACRSRLLGRRYRPFSRKARRGSSHGRPALPCTIRQLSAAFFPGTLSRHSRIFHCHGVYSPRGLKSRDATCLFFHPAHIKGENGSGKGWGTERSLCLKQGKIRLILAEHTQKRNRAGFQMESSPFLGRDDKTRTCDLAPPRRVRYQLRYIPLPFICTAKVR